MNQIINMIMRTVMRKLLNKGIDAGFNKAASMRGNKGQQPQGEIDDHGNPIKRGNQNRQPGGRSAKQAKQAMKMARRAGRM